MAAQTEWPALQARVSNRLSRYFCTTPFKLRNARPMVSFSFDDFPDSAADVGVPILDRYDAKATFYVAGSQVDKWSDHWQGVAPGKIDWSVTVNDATTWTRPWTFAVPLTMNDSEPVFEYACHENNYALGGILRGARVAESEAAAAKSEHK